MNCTNCGSPLPQGSRFCVVCGQAVGANAAAQPANPVSVPSPASSAPGSVPPVPGVAGIPQPGSPIPAPQPAAMPMPNTTQAPGIPGPQRFNAAASSVPGVSSVPDIPATPGAAPSATAAKPMTAKQKRYVIIGIVAVAACILLAIVYSTLNSTVFGPKNTINSYLDAIAAGNFDQANSIADPQVSGAQAVLLTSDAAQSDGTIINQRITSTKENPDGSVQAIVTYSFSGRDYTKTLNVATSGRKFLFFDNWAITNPMVGELQVTVPNVVSSVKVNDIPVSSKNSTSTNSTGSESTTTTTLNLKVYPGSYTVTTGSSPFLTGSDVKLNSVAADDVTSVASSGTLKVKPTQKLKDALNGEVKKKIDKCAAKKEADPDGCPFGEYFYGDDDDYRNFAWTVVSYPKVSDSYIDIEQGSFGTTSSSGKMKLSYERKSYDDEWKPDDTTTTANGIRGTFTISGNKVKVAFNSDNND
ncbi:zinc-ribbon domain-containing protein [Bifidobacterium sp. ESL0764]|uniref:zinc-ribbon domain-containing protein n=1 Tax=Bifidobacterium sp. ESL0764 TaxID=2983228 RepID=UPI0023F930F1|nr:zinc-ribbon domain-containing protein [Bifidobacterium sp. ESL0764]WEV65676.1 hypothetical protein OZX71_08000 [Bifidobacterium sp. ESL0764]